VIDATCPLVTKVHNEAHKYAKEGRQLVLVGHRGHQEVKGTMGQESMHLVDERDDMDLPDWAPERPITVLTQTTLSVDDTQNAIDEIKSRFTDVLVRNDLCYATTNRQTAVKQLCSLVDLVLVIGAPESSNCNRLREVAETSGVTAYMINGPEELDLAWLNGIDNIGITSGASTPDYLVQAVIEAISPDEVVPIDGVDEDVSFVLPKELRSTSQ
jgi:4-hydroxy-3-methylbut-2-enyl diphosphate reductase